MNKISIIKKKLKQGIDYPAYKRSSIADLRFQLRITEVPSFVNQEKNKQEEGARAHGGMEHEMDCRTWAYEQARRPMRLEVFYEPFSDLQAAYRFTWALADLHSKKKRNGAIAPEPEVARLNRCERLEE